MNGDGINDTARSYPLCALAVGEVERGGGGTGASELVVVVMAAAVRQEENGVCVWSEGVGDGIHDEKKEEDD